MDSMVSGAAVVSDFSRHLSDDFKSGEDIMFFNRASPNEVVGAVGQLLEGDRGETLAKSGYERAMQTALWRHRAEKLVGFVS